MARMRSGLLEIPPQLVEHLGLERGHQLIPDNLFGPLTDLRELRRHDDPKRARAVPGAGRDVDDHAAADGLMPIGRRHRSLAGRVPRLPFAPRQLR
jgi:hypothetical protein